MRSIDEGARARRSVRWLGCAAFAVAASSVALGCTTTTEEKVDRTMTSPTTEVGSSGTAGNGQATELASLGLALELPESFEVADDPDLALLARSLSPQAILSISTEPSSVVDHQPETGETVEQVSLGGRDAVIVLNADVDGLPSGIVANELLVDNGPDSFSLIFSSDPESLARLWQPMIESIRFDA